VKPKRLKGKKLTGETFISLAVAYTQAINNGSVPNIDSAWKSINNYEINQTLLQAKEIVLKRSVEFVGSIQQ
jgi:hypothetical protein